MVNRLVLAVTGQPDLPRAWRSLVSPEDKIGIKISAAGGELFTTHRDIVNAIVDGLVAAGHARSSIIVWDRSIGRELGKPAIGRRLRDIRSSRSRRMMATIPTRFLPRRSPGRLIWGDLDYRSDLGTVPLLSEQE